MQPISSQSAPTSESHVARLGTSELLAELVDRPLSEHAELYQRVHERLQVALAEIDGA